MDGSLGIDAVSALAWGTLHRARPLWNGRGSPDWSRLILEFCLLAVIGILAEIVAPVVGRPSARALKVWLRGTGLVLGCAAALILAATGSYAMELFASRFWRDR